MRRAIGDIETIDIKAVHAVIAPEETQRWYERIVNSETDGVSVLEWIRRAPRQRGVKTRTLTLQKLEYLRSNFSALARSSVPVPPERLRAYARRLHRRRLDHAKELTEPGRTLEVVGFLYGMLGRQADRVLRMVEIAIARLWRQAHERVRVPCR